MAEVIRPAARALFSSSNTSGHGSVLAGTSRLPILVLKRFMLFLDGTCTQAPLAVPLVAMGTERVAKEIEALLPGISQRGLVLIDLEPEPCHYVGIRDDVTTERFATTRQPPPQSPRRRSPGRWRGAPNRTGRASRSAVNIHVQNHGKAECCHLG